MAVQELCETTDKTPPQAFQYKDTDTQTKSPVQSTGIYYGSVHLKLPGRELKNEGSGQRDQPNLIYIQQVGMVWQNFKNGVQQVGSRAESINLKNGVQQRQGNNVNV